MSEDVKKTINELHIYEKRLLKELESNSSKTLLFLTGKATVFLIVIFIDHSSFPKRVVASTDSCLSNFTNCNLF